MTEDRASEIRDQMIQIRSQLGVHAQTAVDEARRTADWRTYVPENPWVWAGIAAVVGYILIPRRQQIRAVVDSEAIERALERANLSLSEPGKKSSSTWMALLLPLLRAGAMHGATALWASYTQGRQEESKRPEDASETSDEQAARRAYPR